MRQRRTRVQIGRVRPRAGKRLVTGRVRQHACWPDSGADGIRRAVSGTRCAQQARRHAGVPAYLHAVTAKGLPGRYWIRGSCRRPGNALGQDCPRRDGGTARIGSATLSLRDRFRKSWQAGGRCWREAARPGISLTGRVSMSCTGAASGMSSRARFGGSGTVRSSHGGPGQGQRRAS